MELFMNVFVMSRMSRVARMKGTVGIRLALIPFVTPILRNPDGPFREAFRVDIKGIHCYKLAALSSAADPREQK
jgi:hypothetical protein